jgi:integrase
MLRRMLRLGAKDRLVANVPAFDMLREAPARAGFVDDARYRALLRHLRPDLRVVVAIGFAFGWRIRSEVLTLQRSQVDLAAGTLRLEPGSTKNQDGRLVYMTSEVRQLLGEQLGRVDGLSRKLGRIIPDVFPHLTGRHQGTRIEEFRKAWKKARRAAGLPGLLVHDLRRSAVRAMEQCGVPRSVAMKITGHRTEAVYRRYAIVSDADLREAARRMGSGTLPGTLTAVRENGVAQTSDMLATSR